MKFDAYMEGYLAEKGNSQKTFGDLISVSQAMVYAWLANVKGISGEKVIPICEATTWQVTPHELRPDLYPHPQDGLPEDMRCACVKDAA